MVSLARFRPFAAILGIDRQNAWLTSKNRKTTAIRPAETADFDIPPPFVQTRSFYIRFAKITSAAVLPCSELASRR
jgi:hypothetical protein